MKCGTKQERLFRSKKNSRVVSPADGRFSEYKNIRVFSQGNKPIENEGFLDEKLGKRENERRELMRAIIQKKKLKQI
jgi:hypothetical protein